MKLEEYKNAMGRLVAEEEQKQQVWQAIGQAAGGKKKCKKASRLSAAAAAMACVVLASGAFPAIASNVAGFFQGFFTAQQNQVLDQSGYGIADMVEKDIFYDDDGHVSIEVLEMVSDGMTALMTVKYTALDDMGRQWLANEKLMQLVPGVCHIFPAYPGNNLKKYGANGSSGGELIPQLSTETEKYFAVIMEIDRNSYGTDELNFEYAMTFEGMRHMPDEVMVCDARLYVPKRAIRQARLKAVTNHMEFTKYRVLPAQGGKGGVRPQSLYVSGLSYMLFLETDDIDIWKKVDGKDSWMVQLQTADGNTYEADGWLGPVRGDEIGCPMENIEGLLMASGNFVHYSQTEEGLLDRRFVSFDPQKIETFVFGGKEYRLQKE